jgi:hypothetical protein
VNHRELVLSARKKAKFHFLQLPEDLQDEVIAKLDSQELTLEAARDYLAGLGHSLSHEAIASYYRAVRRERRIYDASQELTRIFESFGDQSVEDSIRGLTNYLVAVAAQKLADGEVAMKVDLGQVIKAFAKAAEPAKAAPARGADAGAEPETPARKSEFSEDTLQKIRDIYGL